MEVMEALVRQFLDGQTNVISVPERMMRRSKVLGGIMTTCEGLNWRVYGKKNENKIMLKWKFSFKSKKRLITDKLVGQIRVNWVNNEDIKCSAIVPFEIPSCSDPEFCVLNGKNSIASYKLIAQWTKKEETRKYVDDVSGKPIEFFICNRLENMDLSMLLRHSPVLEKMFSSGKNEVFGCTLGQLKSMLTLVKKETIKDLDYQSVHEALELSQLYNIKVLELYSISHQSFLQEMSFSILKLPTLPVKQIRLTAIYRSSEDHEDEDTLIDRSVGNCEMKTFILEDNIYSLTRDDVKESVKAGCEYLMDLFKVKVYRGYLYSDGAPTTRHPYFYPFEKLILYT
ncbi:hypothetical protein CRE_23626 [Caenorhabditis remanei]|uniref:Uncharacterized protein n=1 Tax=Caenorhabditis remanei TaxID=31234 RepID=E3MVY0_CAERE|nr:hypothetical protein CRE_23626 [Caenorhabditis remanei]